jgi:hypothetical protein
LGGVQFLYTIFIFVSSCLYILKLNYLHEFNEKENIMNTTFKTIVIVLAVLVIGGGLFFAGQTYSRWKSASTYGVGWMPMMGGRGWDNNNYGYSPMMNGRGNGYGPMMGNGRGPMMGGGFGYGSGSINAQPLTVDEARQAAQKYLDMLGVSGLELGEVMIFDNNAYVVVKEASTGIGAFELLVDPVSKFAYPEHGPNMMWNLKYTGLNHQNMMGGRGFMMGGMMGQNFLDTAPADVSAKMTVTEEQAVQAAQAYLDQYLPGTTVAGHATEFYGYYTLDFAKDGEVAGMLSVNGYSGQVFVHNWHGTFIEESE